jgi:acetyl-CoA decarbonylase/synthase complex subunit gamma
MTVTQGIYEINNPGRGFSPVAVTTNFSLTYFIVSRRDRGQPGAHWLLIKDTEGLRA